MKNLSFPSALLALFLFAAPTLAQTTDPSEQIDFQTVRPKARLFDELLNTTCELTMMTTDNLIISIQNDPSLTGVVIIYGSASEFSRTEWMIRNHLNNRKVRDFVELKRGGAKGQRAVVQFWLVPRGAEAPEISPKPTEEDLKEVKIATFTKPTIFSSEYMDGVPGCTLPLDIDGYAQLLKSNPKYRGNIVVLGPSRSENRAEAKRLLKKLMDSGVRKSKVRTFSQRSPDGGTELWIIP